MEQRKEVGTKDSSLSTLHNTFLFIASLLFPAFYRFRLFCLLGLTSCVFLLSFCFIGLSIFPSLLP